jgi:hypothetical protein
VDQITGAVVVAGSQEEEVVAVVVVEVAGETGTKVI